ncbi:hypothetical protein [Pyrobaculum sp.]|uniref:hypothetical protein n=1 Tax=Pyrobaculum sp. TaxID=2004705 RepID=UPI003D0E4340
MGKVEKVLRWLWENSGRWAGLVAGPPGSGKTTFIRALLRVKRDSALLIRTKECDDEKAIAIEEKVVLQHIASALHFTAERSIMPAIDRLTLYVNGSIESLISTVESKFKPDIAEWIKSRLEMIMKLKQNDKIFIPTCLQNYDEPYRRLTLGLLYAVRPKIPLPIILDDSFAFIINESYAQAFVAMMRPYLLTINAYPDSRMLLSHSPVVLTPARIPATSRPPLTPLTRGAQTPGSGKIHRLVERDQYVILFNGTIEKVKFKDIANLAQS